MTSLQSLEHVLVKLEEPLPSRLYRLMIGLAILPAYYRVFGAGASSIGLLLFFIAILATLRAGPLVIRKILPFSSDIKEVWSERRRIAKRYDSYQWQKLLWIGLGMTGYAIGDRTVPTGGLLLSLSCVVAGLIGLVVWRSHVVHKSSTAP